MKVKVKVKSGGDNVPLNTFSFFFRILFFFPFCSSSPFVPLHFLKLLRSSFAPPFQRRREWHFIVFHSFMGYSFVRESSVGRTIPEQGHYG